MHWEPQAGADVEQQTTDEEVAEQQQIVASGRRSRYWSPRKLKALESTDS